MGLKGHLLLTVTIHKAKSWIFTRSRLSFGDIIKYAMMLDQAKSYSMFNKKLKKVKTALHYKYTYLKVYVSTAEDSAGF